MEAIVIKEAQIGKDNQSLAEVALLVKSKMINAIKTVYDNKDAIDVLKTQIADLQSQIAELQKQQNT